MTQVQISKRLSNVPAIIVSQFPSSMKTYIQFMEPAQLEAFKNNHTMEINPSHKLIVGLNNLRKIDLPRANLIIRQLLDNTLLACGLLLDPTDYVKRVTNLMETSVEQAIQINSTSASHSAHRPVEGEEEKKKAHPFGSSLGDAYQKMQENFQSKFDTPTEVEIGPDGKPKVK